MDPLTSDVIVMFLAAVVLPLIMLGLFADRFGADSRDLPTDRSGSTSWDW